MCGIRELPVGTVCSCAGGLNAAPESFFPTLPSLSLLVEDAAEGFSSLFSRSSPDLQGADDADDAKSGTVTPCPFLVLVKPGIGLSAWLRSLSWRSSPEIRGANDAEGGKPDATAVHGHPAVACCPVACQAMLPSQLSAFCLALYLGRVNRNSLFSCAGSLQRNSIGSVGNSDEDESDSEATGAQVRPQTFSHKTESWMQYCSASSLDVCDSARGHILFRCMCYV